jgi:hypothetical protein
VIVNFRKKALALFCLAAVLIGQSAFLNAQSSEGDEINEYQVKGAFLYHFGKFVDWPESAFAKHQDSFLICVFGQDPFGKALDHLLQGKSIKDRPIRLERITESETPTECNILYVSASEQDHVRDILRDLEAKSVLTVGEGPDFNKEGGVIRFLVRDKKVRFEINTEAGEKAGLKISSQLLKLTGSS